MDSTKVIKSVISKKENVFFQGHLFTLQVFDVKFVKNDNLLNLEASQKCLMSNKKIIQINHDLEMMLAHPKLR